MTVTFRPTLAARRLSVRRQRRKPSRFRDRS